MIEKWEYKVLYQTRQPRGFNLNFNLEAELNGLGAQGWELVTATNGVGAMYTLKRRRND